MSNSENNKVLNSEELKKEIKSVVKSPTMVAIGDTLSSDERVRMWQVDPNTFHERQQKKMLAKVGTPYSKEYFDLKMKEITGMIEEKKVNVVRENKFTSMIDSATKGFDKILTMSQVIFYLGIIIFSATFIVDILGIIPGTGISIDSIGEIIGSGFFGAIGVGGIVTHFIWRPQRSVQESVGNLAQINIAFSDFKNQSELMLEHMRKPNISFEMIEKLSKRIGHIRNKTIKHIEHFVEEDLPLTKIRRSISEMDKDDLEIIEKDVKKLLKA